MRHDGEFFFHKKFSRAWASVPLKVLTAPAVLFIGYSLYWFAVTKLTGHYFEGDMSEAFFMIIPAGAIVSVVLGLANAFGYWWTIRRLGKTEQSSSL